MSKNQHSFYVPTRFGEAVTRATDFINSSPGAAVPKEEFMILSDCSSLWYSNVYVSVATEKVKGATVVKISGDFLTKEFEGDYSNIGKWVKEVKKILAEARMLLELGEGRCDKFYFYYPTCPKCANCKDELTNLMSCLLHVLYSLE